LNKPAGLPAQPTLDEARKNLFGLTQDFLKERAAATKQDEVYLGMHHRIDRDTSGVMLFTEKKEVNKNIGDQFSNHTIRKIYEALCVKADLPQNFTMED